LQRIIDINSGYMRMKLYFIRLFVKVTLILFLGFPIAMSVNFGSVMVQSTFRGHLSDHLLDFVVYFLFNCFKSIAFDYSADFLPR